MVVARGAVAAMVVVSMVRDGGAVAGEIGGGGCVEGGDGCCHGCWCVAGEVRRCGGDCHGGGRRKEN